MATRAERFRAETERTRSDRGGVVKGRAKTTARAKEPARRKRSAAVHASLLDGEVSGRQLTGETTARRNLKRNAKSFAALEASPTTKPPSRKSSRRSHNRTKASTTLTATHELRLTAPRSRHEMKGG